MISGVHHASLLQDDWLNDYYDMRQPSERPCFFVAMQDVCMKSACS